MATPEGATIAGIYMEGPYINPNFGSMNNMKGVKHPDLLELIPEH